MLANFIAEVTVYIPDRFKENRGSFGFQWGNPIPEDHLYFVTIDSPENQKQGSQTQLRYSAPYARLSNMTSKNTLESDVDDTPGTAHNLQLEVRGDTASVTLNGGTPKQFQLLPGRPRDVVSFTFSDASREDPGQSLKYENLVIRSLDRKPFT